MSDNTLIPITDQARLDALCEALADAPFLAVDTEFHRETTFWPRLCLIQVAAPGVEALVDPQAEGLSILGLLDLLADTSRVKVMHAARQDQEIFNQLLGKPLAPIFDTQTAAMALGIGDSVSYDTLIEAVLGRDVDKSSQYTDWRKRPLSDKQLDYALGDVTHLRDAYPILLDQLKDKGRLDWIVPDNEAIADPALYEIDPSQSYKRLKIRRRKPVYAAIVRALAAWREHMAVEQDRPRSRILKDDAIYAIADAVPRSRGELSRIKGVPKGFAHGADMDDLLSLIGHVSENPEQYATDEPRARSGNGVSKGYLHGLRELLEAVASEATITPRFIANAADLRHLAAGEQEDVACLSGWRREIFGEKALELLAGPEPVIPDPPQEAEPASEPEAEPEEAASPTSDADSVTEPDETPSEPPQS